MNIRISAKFYLILLLFSLCMAFSGLLFLFFQNRVNEAKTQAFDQAQLFALISSRALDAHHTELLWKAQRIALMPETISALVSHTCPIGLRVALDEHGYANIHLLTAQGTLVCSAFQAQTPNPPHKEFSILAATQPRGAVGSFFQKGPDWFYPVGFPILDARGQSVGSVSIVDTSAHLELLHGSLLERGADVSYIDSLGRVGLSHLSHTPMQAHMQAHMQVGHMALPFMRPVLGPGVAEHIAILPSGYFSSAIKAPLSGWTALISIPSSAVYDPLYSDILHQTLILGALSLFAWLTIWVIAHRLSTATEVLVRAAGNADSLFNSCFTGVSEIDRGIVQMRQTNIEKTQAQAAVELWRTASERTRSGMAILNFFYDSDGSDLNPKLIVELCNPAFETLSGMGPCVGQDVFHDAPDSSILGDTPTQKELALGALHGVATSCAGQGLDANDQLCHVLMSLQPIVAEESSARVRFCLTLEDVTDIAYHEAALEKQSTTDALTHLPNRALFTRMLSQSIALSQRNHSMCAVGMYDLDHFKFINDSIGHEMGDQVIAEVSRRLTSILRPSDTLSRFGGDEFGIIFSDLDGVEIIASLVEHARAALHAPVHMAGQSFTLTFSAGVSVYPTDGDNPQSLMSAADIAMFQAKAMGRGNVQFHARQMSESFAERLTIEQALKTALAENTIEFLYQPKINLSTGQPCGMEALARWNHPVLGEISPSKFIPLAEESELIAILGDIAIRAALRDAKILWDEGFRNMPVAINVSARQIKDGLIEKLVAALHEFSLPASSLHVEITESSVMPNSEVTRFFLSELRRIGIQVALDDFGTGWSNMAMLKTLPLSYLKMDRSFIVGLGKDEKDAAIAKAIIGLAKALGVEVIAEGVETQMQAQQLHYLQADQLQGYYICKPLRIEAVSAWLHGGCVFQGATLTASAPLSYGIAPLAIHPMASST